MRTEDRILDSIEKLHGKVDKTNSKIHKMDIKVVSVQGQLKAMNGQVNRNKEDIKGLKGFVFKVTAGIASMMSALISGVVAIFR